MPSGGAHCPRLPRCPRLLRSAAGESHGLPSAVSEGVTEEAGWMHSARFVLAQLLEGALPVWVRTPAVPQNTLCLPVEAC